jgi:uncharacterized protein YbaA (DUF1428 family)
MAQYVDSFVIPLPKKNIDAYKKMARTVGKVFIEHGALAYRECLAEDVPYGKTTSFARSVERKNSETVVLAFATYKSRKHRDAVTKKAMSDPKMQKVFAGSSEVFDASRMYFGGFDVIVDI